MTISNILAIQNLMPGSEPDFFVTGREPERKPYKFRDNDDLLAAQADAQTLVERLAEKHDFDEWASQNEFCEIIKQDPRLESAMLHSIFDHLVDTDPGIKKALAKRERAQAKTKAAK